MRIQMLSVVSALLLLVPATARSEIRQPQRVATAQATHDSYYSQGSSIPGEAEPAPLYAHAAQLTGESSEYESESESEPSGGGYDDACCGCYDPCCSGGGGGGCGGCGLLGPCCLGEPFKLRDCVCGCDSWLDFGGWTEMGYTNNNVPLSQAYNDLLSFNDVPDNLNLNQQWLWIEKLAKPTACSMDWGFRIDTLYGTDAQKSQAFGNPNAGVRGFGTWDASLDHNQYGWAIPQCYGELAYGDWSVKVGHFFTLIGYEVIPAPQNFFYTHSYTFFNSQPLTNTGAYATYTGYEDVTFYGGWVLGWDTGFDQLNSGSAWMGGVAIDFSDNLTFTYMSTAGNFGWRDGGSDDSYNQSLVLIADLSERLQYVLQSNLINTNNPGVSEFDTIGACNYLFYSLNDCTALGLRAEWWKADGVSFYEVTGGFNHKFSSNLIVRPEIRQDWAPGIGLDESTFGIDAILTY